MNKKQLIVAFMGILLLAGCAITSKKTISRGVDDYASSGKFKSIIEKKSMDDTLILSLSSDKEIYSVGDAINFTYTFLNNSSDFIYILPWGGHYAINWITAYGEDNKELEEIPLVIVGLQFVPSENDFVYIGPGETHSIIIKGKITKGEYSKFSMKERKKYKGLFLDFYDSAIYLENSGIFKIKAFYSGEEDWGKEGKELYNLNNVWVGEIESDEVKIIIAP